MKKMFLTSIIAIVLLSLASQSAFTQSEKKLKAKIEEINVVLMKSVLANDHKTPLAYYTDDIISMPSYRSMLKGIEAVKESGEKTKASGMKMTKFELEILKIISSGDLVIEIGKYDFAMEIPGSPEPMLDNGKYVTVWEKQSDGSLKIKVETWNTDNKPR